MREQKYRAIKVAAYALLLFVLFILQTSRGVQVHLFGATANYLAFFLATVAVFEGPYIAGSLGFVAGLFLSTNSMLVEGLEALYLGLFGIVVGYLGHLVLREVLPTTLFCGALCVVLQHVLGYAFYYGLALGIGALSAAKMMALELAISLPFGVVLFFIVRAIHARFTESET